MTREQVPLWTSENNKIIETKIQNQAASQYCATYHAEDESTMSREAETEMEIARRNYNRGTRSVET